MEQGIEGRQRFGQAGVGSAHLERQNKQKHVRPAKNNGFRHKHVDFGGAPVSVGSALIATYNAKHARDMDSSRLRYDHGPSERCRAADRKTQQGCRVAGLAPACADTRSHIRQLDRAGTFLRHLLG